MKIKLKTLYILICAVIFCSMILVMISSFSDVKVSSDKLDDRPKIIIDAGHGGEDGGAEAGGVLEKDINLSISLILADMISAQGYEVETVREEDISVYSSEAKTLSEKKTSDLHNRLDLFNSDKRNIVVSIHQNKFDNPKYYGTQIFYSPNHKDSEKLASCIKTSVTMLLEPDNTRENKPADQNIFILDQAEVPAVIVECGFLSNEEERQKLTSDDYQRKLSFAVMLGVIDYCHQITS